MASVELNDEVIIAVLLRVDAESQRRSSRTAESQIRLFTDDDLQG